MRLTMVIAAMSRVEDMKWAFSAISETFPYGRPLHANATVIYNLVGVLLFLPWVYNYPAPLLSRAGRVRAAWPELGLGPLFLLFFRLQYFLGFDDFRAGF